MCYKALKAGPGNMHAFAASVGQAFCVTWIVMAPGLMFLCILTMGLASSLLLSWGVALWVSSGWVYEQKKFGRLYLLPASIAGVMILASIVFLPCPNWAPAWIQAIQKMPILPWW
jgi:hypothetical protein